MQNPPTMRRHNVSQLSGLQILFAAIIAIGLLLAINFSTRISASQPLQEAHNRTAEEIEQLRAEQAALIEQRNTVRGDAYVERWARSEGKMVREGEVLVNPMAINTGDAQVAPAVVIDDVQTTPLEPEPWQVWWALFFDTAPPT